MKLTTAAAGQTGAWIVQNFDNGAAASSFTIHFRVLAGGGSTPPADGFSVNFANDISPISTGEEGSGTGLSICFDSYDNGGSEGPAIDVKWGLTPIGHVLTSVSQGAGGTSFYDVSIQMDADGTLDVSYNGVPIYTNFATPYAPFVNGRFSFEARTGLSYDNHFMDDVAITTVPAPGPEIGVSETNTGALTGNASTVDFGNPGAGNSSTRQFTITNTGTLALTGLGLSLDGANAAEFSIVDPSATLGTHNFDSGNGGFTVTTPQSFDGPWVYDSVRGSWRSDGQSAEIGHPCTSQLDSPTFTVTRAGFVRLQFAHRWSFEYDGTAWDGGQVRVSVNGGAFTTVGAIAFTQNGYSGAVAGNSVSVLKGQPAFTQTSPNYGAAAPFITSAAELGSFNPGDTIAVEFIFGGDTNTQAQIPGWEIDSFTLTEGLVSNTLAPGDSLSFSVSFSPAASGARMANLHIASTDADENPFEVALLGGNFDAATDDAATSTTGSTRIYVLANDPVPDTTVTAVNGVPGATISADGRAVIVPAGYTGTFTYETSANTSGHVTITPAWLPAGASRWQGLLYDSNGDIAGWMQASKTSRGSFTTSLKIGTAPGRASFRLNASNTATVPTALGSLTVTLDGDGRLDVVVGAVGGSLRPGRMSATVEQHNIALGSIDAAIPGGGTARAYIKAGGDLAVFGKLPDGRSFAAKSRVADNGSFTIYAPVARTLPKAVVAGEFIMADLAATDVTGELTWLMPAQTGGLHAGGVNATLLANGCIFTPGYPLFSGAGTLTVAGGNLATDSAASTSVTAGAPAKTALVPSWVASPMKGTFVAQVKDPARTRGVTASGIYLPKSNSAWGFFRGTTVGGRIELSVP
jgi:hypothetical protein